MQLCTWPSTIQKLGWQEIGLWQLPYLQELVKRYLFFPSQLRSQTNVHSPTPTPVRAYLPKRVAFKCLLDFTEQVTQAPMVPASRPLQGIRCWPLLKTGQQSTRARTPHSSHWTAKSPKMLARETISNALPAASRGRRQRGTGKNLGAELPLSWPVRPFGDQAQLQFLQGSFCLASRRASGIRS